MKKNLAFIIMLILSCSLSSLAGGNKRIPDDFDARNTTLIIEDSPNDKISDQIELIMKKYYPYKYKIETKEDVRAMTRDSAYADRTIYRYILGNDVQLYSITYDNGTTRNSSAEVYYIYDMLLEKEYKTILASNHFSAGSFKHDIKLLVKLMSKLK